MPALAPITISGLASKTGIDVETIRSYERLGLIPKPRRGPGGYLLYRGEDVEILTFTRRAGQLGFSLAAIRELLQLAEPHGGGCSAIYDIAVRQLAEIRTRIEELSRMEQTLRELTARCPREGSAAGCPIISTLIQPH
jgi:MerR family mercuric resistance operon transcriptional regulator